MKKYILIVCMFLIFNGINAQYSIKNFIDQNYIEVTGKAEIEFVPDEIYLKIIIDEKDNKNKQSLEEREQLMIQKLTETGIDVKNNLSVMDFVSNFRDYIFKKNEIYTTKTFQMICHDSKSVVKVFVELEKLNISNISVLRLDHSKIVEYRKQVKVEAMKAAKEKAVDLLSAVNEEIGQTLYVEEHNVANPYQNIAGYSVSNTMMTIKEKSFYKEENIPDIEFQKIRLEYEILARFEIK